MNQDQEPPSYDHAVQASLDPDNFVHRLGRLADASVDSFERGELFTQAFRSQLDTIPPSLIEDVANHGLVSSLGLDEATHANDLFRHPLARSRPALHIMNRTTVQLWPNHPMQADMDLTVQATHPFLAQYGGREARLHYFEVTLVTTHPNSVIAVGLTTRPYPLFRMPGWNRYSVGYHSDDGCKFLEDATGGQDYGPSFKQGDTVGCGYEPVEGNVFFTLNGYRIGYAYTGLQPRHYFASVGADGPATLDVNFGARPFLYDIGDAWAGLTI
ncbi:concanavalin A-like lectin/glucanase domain-containing protein [Syncephalastrum racemosum]|uniref:Concanavalin A-like lectin/glucanase domain-containing protein n=1 Tax=Syncephalastrum racemosum TaxID=13706 RepID=A0A1X2H9X5_SYNRA|nr:concanavalin A-like lectin/glucanase domain-containing protein [Syncephalastrum racemosum]